MNDSSRSASSSVSKEEMDSLLKSQEKKFKGIVHTTVTDIHGRLKDNLKYLKFDVSKLQDVARKKIQVD